MGRSTLPLPLYKETSEGEFRCVERIGNLVSLGEGFCIQILSVLSDNDDFTGVEAEIRDSDGCRCYGGHVNLGDAIEVDHLALDHYMHSMDVNFHFVLSLVPKEKD